MEPAGLLVLLAMGTIAGGINAAVGSGSLLTLPVLLTLGMPPGTAVRTNTVGILFSTIGSVAGYRRELAAEKQELGPLVLVGFLASAAGAVLLLISPPIALDVLVPVLIVVALLLVVFQPRITTAIAARRLRREERTGTAAPAHDGRSPYRSPALLTAMGGASVYGGYFTAAQGIVYLGVLGAFTGRTMGRVNSVKNLMGLVVNLTAAVVYVIAFFAAGTEIVWLASLAIAIGSLLGGFFGAHLAKRLPESALRGIIVVVALAALVRELLAA